uniref:Uncharacterized protein n=1 Tax=Rhizophora mucronata TaxID=61149 RepID=A0A2P2QF95_RHIMU
MGIWNFNLEDKKRNHTIKLLELWFLSFL